MICGKFREEMWEKKKRNWGEFLSNLCQGLLHTIYNVALLLCKGIVKRKTNTKILYRQRLECGVAPRQVHQWKRQYIGS